MEILLKFLIGFICCLIGNFIALFTCTVIFGDLTIIEFVKLWAESVWELLTFIPRKIMKRRNNNAQ